MKQPTDLSPPGKHLPAASRSGGEDPPRPPVNRPPRAAPEALAAPLSRIAKVALGRRGFAEASLISDWRTIVGSLLASYSVPLRVTFPPGERSDGILFLRVARGGMATQIQHQQAQILQRINGYFGYQAVAKLTILQGHVPPPPPRPKPPPPLSPEQEQALTEQTAACPDPDLREALLRLARARAVRQPR